MARRTYETPEYVAMLHRLTRGLGRRLADGDPSDVAAALDVSRELDKVIRDSVRAMRETHGFSWQQIADELGMTRQGAQQRFGKGE